MVKRKQTSQHQLKVAYGIDRVVTGKFVYQQPAHITSTSNYELSYHFVPNVSLNVSQDLVFIRLVVTGSIVGTDTEVVSIDNVFGFKVENLKNYTVKQDGHDILIENFQPYLVVFVSIAISTTRGILIEKLNGTIFRRKILPIIDPNVFFTKVEKTTNK